MTFLISYDLNQPGQNYAGLYEEIKKLGAWWHNLDSTWLVDTSLSASEVRDRLKRRIDSSDGLLVVKTGGEWGSAGISDSGNQWLKEHVASSLKALAQMLSISHENIGKLIELAGDLAKKEPGLSDSLSTFEAAMKALVKSVQNADE